MVFGFVDGHQRYHTSYLLTTIFFFCRAELPEVRRLKQIFQKYEAASGQSINYQKSGIFFSPNTHEMLREGVRAVLGIYEPLDTGRYIGMASLVGRNKKAVFRYLKERVWQRIQGWRGKPITKGVRRFLLKQLCMLCQFTV
ncbi:hypothetical protein LINGRAHAP2_LOCUS4484 [Linum grandiflorum]